MAIHALPIFVLCDCLKIMSKAPTIATANYSPPVARNLNYLDLDRDRLKASTKPGLHRVIAMPSGQWLTIP